MRRGDSRTKPHSAALKANKHSISCAKTNPCKMQPIVRRWVKPIMRALLLALVFAACTTAPPAHDGYSIKAMRRVHGGRLWEPLYRDVSACLARQDFVRKPPLRYRAVQIWFADRISSTLPYLSGARIYGIYLAPRTIILAVPQIDTALAAVVRHEFYHAISNRGHFRGVMEACGITGIPASALP